jgi:hypothetical protein
VLPDDPADCTTWCRRYLLGLGVHPALRDDLALAPALLLASVLLAWLCLEVDRSTRPA